MLTAIYIIAAIIIFGLALFGIGYAARAYRRQRGTRVIVCPETENTALVEVDALHAALTSLVGRTDMRLQDCSRWPQKRDCGQECMLQIETAPDECLVRSVLAKWYRGKRCVYCRKPFEEINWIDHEPALLNSDRELVEWREVPLDSALKTLETHNPVCWNCFIAQSFRRDYPQLVVDRPARSQTFGGR